MACERDLMRLYHNPRCSKSRQAVALLTEAGYEFETRLYLKDGIAQEDLEILASVENIIRLKDVVGDVDTSMLDSNEIQALLTNQPKALERPVLIHNGEGILGRPPELILKHLGHQ
ncbi:MAG: arsenate reductase family protein [Candidatus Poseidoniaceae archaeon]